MPVSVPGVVWITVVVTLATTLGPWIDQYLGKPWGPLILIVLGAIVKGLMMWVEYLKEPKDAQLLPGVRSITYTRKVPDNKLKHFLLD
jgi:hypothetical protein